MTDADQILKQVAISKSTGEKQITVKQLRTRSEDPDVNRARLLAAYCLYAFFKRDADRVISMLDCSKAHIELAERMANRPDEDGVTFRAELQKIKGTQVAAHEHAPTPVQEESSGSDHLEPVDLLFRIGKLRYNLERKDIVGLKPHNKSRSARRVIAFVAKRVFDMDSGDIAVVYRCARQTVTGYLTEAFEVYGSDEKFTLEVDEACKLIGVRINSKRSKRSRAA